MTKEEIEEVGFVYNFNVDPEDTWYTREHKPNGYQCIMEGVRFCNSSRDVDLKLTYLGWNNNPDIYKIEMYERNFFEWYPIFEGRLKTKEDLKIILNYIGVND